MEMLAARWAKITQQTYAIDDTSDVIDFDGNVRLRGVHCFVVDAVSETDV